MYKTVLYIFNKVYFLNENGNIEEFNKEFVIMAFLTAVIIAISFIIISIVLNQKKKTDAENEELKKAKEKETRQRENLEKVINQNTKELYETTLKLKKTNEEIVELLGDTVEMRDKESGYHIQRVKTFSYILAQQVMKDCPEYGLTMEDVEIISSVSALHDVGKIMIPDSILLKPGAFTDEEFEIMKTHCVKGVEILKRAPKLWGEKYISTAMDICHYHHEKWDGKGYPEGISGDDIPISAQIVSVADVYDALAFERVYKGAYKPQKALEMIKNGECGAFSEKLLRCLDRCYSRFESSIIDLEDDISFNGVKVNEEDVLKGVKILIVDDSDVIRELNREILEDEGAIVEEAKNGVMAIEKFSRDNTFDLILMDVIMPEVDGIKATRSIRNLEAEGQRVPIFALTSEASDAEINACLNAGADDCIMKPMRICELVRMLEKYGK